MIIITSRDMFWLAALINVVIGAAFLFTSDLVVNTLGLNGVFAKPTVLVVIGVIVVMSAGLFYFASIPMNETRLLVKFSTCAKLGAALLCASLILTHQANYMIGFLLVMDLFFAYVFYRFWHG